MDKEKVRIKICGLRRREDILAVNRYLPDYAGFILGFPQSFRCISEDELAGLTGMPDPRICPVGVFVLVGIRTLKLRKSWYMLWKRQGRHTKWHRSRTGQL